MLSSAPSLIPCSACGGDSFRPLFEVAAYQYVGCTWCASARLEPLPQSDPVELYDSTYFVGANNGGYLDYEADEIQHARNAATRLERVAPLLPQGPQHLIDIGCATGYVLDEAVARGWTAVGVDASAHARDRSAARGHLVVEDFLTALTTGPPPTVVTAFQVLEHMRDPSETIAQVVSALAPGGILAIETWDRTSRVGRLFGAKWQQANPPSVIHLLSHRGISLMVQRHGAELVDFGPTSKYVSLGLVVDVANGRWPALGLPLRPLASHNSLRRLAIHYRLGDLVTALVRVRTSSESAGLVGDGAR